MNAAHTDGALAASASFNSSARGPWTRSYEPGGWARALPLLDAVGAPKLIFVAGWVVAASLLVVLQFFPSEVRKLRGVGLWAPVLGVGCLTTALLLAVVLVGTQTGGIRAAVDEVWGAQALAVETSELAASLNSSCAALRAEMAAITVDCPVSVRARLEGSVRAMEEKLQGFARDFVSLSGAITELPAALAELGAATGSLAFYFGVHFGCSTLLLAVATITVWAAAADAHFGQGRILRRLASFGQIEVTILEVLSAAACVAVAIAASEELSIGARAATACQNDVALDLARQRFGANSSIVSAARFYVNGSGGSVALASLSHAQGMIGLSHQWIDKYQWAIHRYCPRWNAEGVGKVLQTLQARLNRSQELLAPERFYALYDTAVHADLCDSFLPSLGFLAVLQIPIALILLPAFTIAAAVFLRGASEPAREYSRLCQEDSGDDDGDRHETESNQINSAYYAIYAFSVLIFIIGAFMYFLPSTSIVRRVTGTLLYASGVFLLMNSDLIVSFLRLHHQLERCKKQNVHFEQGLKDQGAKVQELEKAKKGFSQIDRQFGGSAKRALHEVETMALTNETDIKLVLKDLMSLYSDKNKDRFISKGSELDQTFELFDSVFSGVVPEYEDREHKLRSVLESHRRFKQDGGVEPNVLAALMSKALTRDIDKVASYVESILNKSDKSRSSAGKSGKRSASAGAGKAPGAQPPLLSTPVGPSVSVSRDAASSRQRQPDVSVSRDAASSRQRQPDVSVSRDAASSRQRQPDFSNRSALSTPR